MKLLKRNLKRLKNMCMAEVNIDDRGYICPETTDKIALIDADTVIFASCTVFEYIDDLLAQDMYSSDEWDMIVNDPGWIPEEALIRCINLEEAYSHSMDKIKSIMERTGCSDFELHFTRGRESFPYTMVDKDYKGNRKKGDIPWGLGDLKDLFVERNSDKAFNNYLYEADHIVVCKKRDNPDKYVMCAVDKDVYLGIEGKHFNYYSSTKWNIDMKWVEVSADDALRRYVQTLTGDKGDNVIGLDGIGPVKATKALAHCEDEICMWKEVVRMYEKHDRGIIDAITNMRLVDMRQLELNDNNEYEVKLWQPKV